MDLTHQSYSTMDANQVIIYKDYCIGKDLGLILRAIIYEIYTNDCPVKSAHNQALYRLDEVLSQPNAHFQIDPIIEQQSIICEDGHNIIFFIPRKETKNVVYTDFTK